MDIPCVDLLRRRTPGGCCRLQLAALSVDCNITSHCSWTPTSLVKHESSRFRPLLRDCGTSLSELESSDGDAPDGVAGGGEAGAAHVPQAAEAPDGAGHLRRPCGGRGVAQRHVGVSAGDAREVAAEAVERGQVHRADAEAGAGDEMMFAWDANQCKWDHRVLPALRVFRQKFGHCKVKYTFTVPSQFPWPEPAWGLRLGETVQRIRGGGLDVNQDMRELE
ncbi:unnamed protein product [Phytophthora fragariaefolia]|uniref:Unnamed protein product n=1 Tax=Phytophthora fragariaefolia TaxID=1490495 RepID=A0A9W7CXR8_9STRA|nr:unnamed protein product [Phytophthora fragariaefolia]